MATLDCLINLHDSLLRGILYNWLSIEHVAKLDSAYCSSAERQLLLDILSSREFIQYDPVYLNFEHQFTWYIRRSIGMSDLQIGVKISVDENVSNYFYRWGQNIRKVHFFHGASGDLYLIPMHCKNLISVSTYCREREHIFHDILRFNPNLHDIAFDSVSIKPSLFNNVCLPQLRWLRLIGIVLDEEPCRLMGQLCDGMTHLSLSESYVDGPCLIELTARQKHLISLDLSRTTVDVNDIANVVSSCHNLTNLSLRSCEYINDADIHNISQHLHSLCTLDIRGCTEITDRSLTYLREHTAARLTALFLGYIYVTLAEIASLLRHCVNLHTLGIEAYDDMDFHLDYFSVVCQTMTNIKKLHLKGATLIADSVLELVGRYCRSITHLALSTEDYPAAYDYTYFTSKGLLTLQRGCSQLHTLVVFEVCPLLTNELAITLWKELRPGFCITSDDSIDYDAMKCSV